MNALSNLHRSRFLEDMAREEDVVDNVLGNPITPLTDYGECLYCWDQHTVRQCRVL